MEYTFTRTIYGPAIIGDDEVVFFHEVGALQDYINDDPQFLEKAYAFCQETIAEYGKTMSEAVTKNIVGADRAMSIMAYWQAVQSLKRFEWEMKQHTHGFPGPNPTI